MSQGWIKFEKSLREDLRIKRMALKLGCNHGGLQGVTLVLGGLAQLWMHADSFARDDDTLDITIDEIDQLTGIDGFAKSLPVDWLEVLDENRVKLPGFHGHNGVLAKRRALIAKRVGKHRARASNQGRLHDDDSGNHGELPDQTRPDQTKEEAGAPPGVHGSLPKKNWDEWLAHRRKRKWPMDPVTLGKQLKLLEPLPTSVQIEVLDNSIQAGWQGLFLPKAAGKPAAKPLSEPPTPEAQAEYQRRMESANRASSERFSNPVRTLLRKQ